jgi:hypothetical protein
VNGKKTWFGLTITALTILGDAARQIGPDFDVNNTIQLAKAIGALVMAVGAIHKLVKGE